MAPKSPLAAPEKSSPPVGRPRALDPNKLATVKLLLAVGCNLKTAAKFVGCAPCTLRRHRLRDAAFEKELLDARHGAETQFLSTLVEAARHNPTAADWLRRRILGTLDDPLSTINLPQASPPTSGLSSAQNPSQFCALPADFPFDFSSTAADHQRAKPAVHSKNNSPRKRAKLQPLVPADYMSPLEFVTQQRRKSQRRPTQ